MATISIQPDAAVMSFDDLAADRQSDSAASVFAWAVQTLERRKNALRILLLEADAVVLHRQAVKTGFDAATRLAYGLNDVES